MTDPAKSPACNATEDALMERFGITRVPADRFHYKSYRYSSLSDAVAQAKRDAES